MSCTANALLTVVAAAALAAAGAHPLVYRSNMSALEFLEHVLMNERHWTPVLAERVKKLGGPPYQDARFKNRLIADEYLVDGMEYDVRSVLVDVVRGFSGLRSFVDYAARALHMALTCHSMRHLAFQAYYVTLLLVKRADAGLVVLEAGRLRENVAVILDKLTVYPANIQYVFNLYWEAVRLLQSNASQRVRDNRYPDEAKQHVELLHRTFVDYLAEYCEPFRWDKPFFDACHIPVTDAQIYDKVLIADVDVDAIMHIGHAHAHHVSTYYRNLGLETLPRTLWQQIFYYTKKVPIADSLNETNMHITAAGARRHNIVHHVVPSAARVPVPAH